MPRALLLAVLLAVSTPLLAQTVESSAGIRVRFDAAGARGIAMGGTGEALSDGFAATANPAALAKQRRSAAIELRHASSSMKLAGDGEGSTVRAKRTGIGGAVLVIPARNATFALSYDEPLRAHNDPPRGPGLNTLISTSLRRLGAAAAWNRGDLSLGAAVQYARLERSLNFDPQLPGPGVTPISITSGEKLTWSTGVQWQIAPALRAGASYRSGAEFEEQYSLNFAIPSSYAAGLAADLGPNVTLAADAVRVRYSESLGFAPLLQGMTDFPFPDVTELHAGAEWRLSTRIPVALRAGWWRDPAHGIRHQSALETDENHVTAGVGIGDRVKVDVAIDRSRNTNRASLSVATNF